MPSEKPTTKTEARRGSKPLVEKKRRARINQSLAELQALVLTSTKKDGYNKQSRVEKADILEMTVRYLQKLQRQQKDEAGPSLRGKFQAGYLECVSEVCSYLTSIEKVDTRVNERLRMHLLVNLHRTHLGLEPGQSTSPQQSSAPTVGSATVKGHVAAEADSCTNSSPKVSTTTPTPSSSPTPSITLTLPPPPPPFPPPPCVTESTKGNSLGLTVACSDTLAGVPVIPSRLPTGQLAFVVPTKDYLQYVDIYSPALPPTPIPTLLQTPGNSQSLMIHSSWTSHQMSTSDFAARVPGLVQPSSSHENSNLVPLHLGDVWRPW